MTTPSKDTADSIQALMEMDYTESMITFCKRFDQTSPIWNLERHSHAYIELMFFLRGEATIDVGAEVLSPATCDMVVYFPNHEHQEAIDLTKTQEVICIWVDVGDFPSHREGAFRLRDTSRTLEWLFIQIEKEYKKESVFSKRLVTCYLTAIFQHMLRQLVQAESASASGAVKRAQDYIKDHFTQSIPVAYLAEYCHISPAYLHRVFQRQLGMTPVQYITSLRILEAKYLLGSSTLSVGEIAEHCGFEDSRYFCRVFKKQAGASPSQYRKNSQVQ